MSARHGVPDTHIWNPETGRWLAEGSDPGAMLKRTAAERHADPRCTHPGPPPVVEAPRVAVEPDRRILALCSMDHLDDDGHPNGGGLQCASRGNLPACALCPSSPTYWRNTYPPGAAESGRDPWDNTLPMGGTRGELVELPERHELDWGKNSGAWFERGKFKPCEICGHGTEQRSPRNKPCHKTCAENWNAAKREGRELPRLQPR